MSGIAGLRIAAGAAGVLVWAYGAREDLATARWIGIGLLAAALILRFLGPRPSRGATDDEFSGT